MKDSAIKQRYNVVLTPEDDGVGFVATSPDKQGPVTYGETRNEALRVRFVAEKAAAIA
jgi:predicted RNase H-like HicB family nuclease